MYSRHSLHHGYYPFEIYGVDVYRVFGWHLGRPPIGGVKNDIQRFVEGNIKEMVRENILWLTYGSRSSVNIRKKFFHIYRKSPCCTPELLKIINREMRSQGYEPTGEGLNLSWHYPDDY